MKPIELTIIGSARTKKNHSRIITNPKTGKPMVIQSKQYVQYEADALKQLHKPAEPVTCACNAQYRYYMPTARKCDLVNLMQATNDILVKGGVIADDNYTIVASHDGSGWHQDCGHRGRKDNSLDHLRRRIYRIVGDEFMLTIRKTIRKAQ